MSLNKCYRSWMILSIAAAGLLAGCDSGKKHATIKEEQYNRWNMTRIGVMAQLAQQQYEVGDYDKCKETLAQCLALNAPHAGIHILSAKVDIEKGSLETAADQLHQALRIDPSNPEPYYLLGVIFQRWQKPDVASDWYAQAFQHKPGDPLYLLAVVEMKITLNKLDDAKKLLNDKLIYFEQTAAVRVALARIATLQNDHVLACKYYREAVLLLPEDTSVRRSYAEALFDAGKFADAAPIFEDLRRLPTTDPDGKPDPVADDANKQNLLLLLGQCYLELKRPYDARNTFQEITRDHPDDPQAYLGLARACISTNELPIALAAARKVTRVDPGNSAAMVLAALVQQKQNKWSDAQTTLLAAQKLAPANTTVLCMLGIAAQHLDHPDAAAGYYQQALNANPDDTWAQELLNSLTPTKVSLVP